jgi:hypothetical protein
MLPANMLKTIILGVMNTIIFFNFIYIVHMLVHSCERVLLSKYKCLTFYTIVILYNINIGLLIPSLKLYYSVVLLNRLLSTRNNPVFPQL